MKLQSLHHFWISLIWRAPTLLLSLIVCQFDSWIQYSHSLQVCSRFLLGFWILYFKPFSVDNYQVSSLNWMHLMSCRMGGHLTRQICLRTSNDFHVLLDLIFWTTSSSFLGCSSSDLTILMRCPTTVIIYLH